MSPKLYTQPTTTVIDTILYELNTTYVSYVKESRYDLLRRNILARSHWAKGLLSIYILFRHLYGDVIDSDPTYARAMDKILISLKTLADDNELLIHRYHWDNYRLDLVSYITSRPSLHEIPSAVDDIACCLGISVTEYIDAGILTIV